MKDAHQLWEAYPTQALSQETFWATYAQAIAHAKQTQQQHTIVQASQAPVTQACNLTEPRLFVINPDEIRSFLKKLWVYQVLPVEKAFTIAWVTLSLFLLVFSKSGGSSQLMTISSTLLALFVIGIAYHYWVICKPLADMQVMIDRLGIVREGAGLDHLSIKYSEITDIRQSPLGLQIFIQPKGYIQDDQTSVLLPHALLDYSVACQLLQQHLAVHHKYFRLINS
jgi:hypothetical protein